MSISRRFMSALVNDRSSSIDGRQRPVQKGFIHAMNVRVVGPNDKAFPEELVFSLQSVDGRFQAADVIGFKALIYGGGLGRAFTLTAEVSLA